MMNILACPVCQDPLYLLEKKWACGNLHSFDISRTGYVHLLLSHQKESRDPGDSAMMVEGRREFLNAGHYANLAATLAAVLSDFRSEIILDVGCGEGYFLHYLRVRLPAATLIGVDISRTAINAAASREKSATFIVSSSFRLPILSDAVDCVLRIMAPSDDTEVTRVLKNNGQYITVTPGPDHLYGLKQLIYANTSKNTPKVSTPAGFELVRREKVYSILDLTGAEIPSLLAMTPYYWSIDGATRAKVAHTTKLSTPIDFDVSVLQKI
ncbi:MAG: methyltransferase domain-containing protein [Bacillota bacterium]|nr:methyltransferase domain-containing protein [Bacillota bacterium]